MFKFDLIARIRVQARTLYHKLHGAMWFPHVPVTLLVFIGAAWLIYSTFGGQWQLVLTHFSRSDIDMSSDALPKAVIGGSLVIMAIGLFLRSRIAWFMALGLIIAAIINVYFFEFDRSFVLFIYLILIAGTLAASWRAFDHANLTASTLFAISAIFMLFSYATFGSFYLGDDFRPPITDLVTALYYSTVTMSTVGYGDFAPQTIEAKLFTISIIVLGVAVFATSLTAIVTPLLNRSMNQIINRKANRMKRENHFVILGNSPLAQNTCKELQARGQPVTRVLRHKLNEDSLLNNYDIVVGDVGDTETLKIAGCCKAIAILAMFEDDSENAFAILAVRALGSSARTVSAVNNSSNMNRMRLVKPDVVIAPQILGGELAAMFVCGEKVTGEHIIDRLFHNIETSSSEVSS